MAEPPRRYDRVPVKSCASPKNAMSSKSYLSVRTLSLVLIPRCSALFIARILVKKPQIDKTLNIDALSWSSAHIYVNKNTIMRWIHSENVTLNTFRSWSRNDIQENNIERCFLSKFPHRGRNTVTAQSGAGIACRTDQGLDIAEERDVEIGLSLLVSTGLLALQSVNKSAPRRHQYEWSRRFSSSLSLLSISSCRNGV